MRLTLILLSVIILTAVAALIVVCIPEDPSAAPLAGSPTGASRGARTSTADGLRPGAFPRELRTPVQQSTESPETAPVVSMAGPPEPIPPLELERFSCAEVDRGAKQMLDARLVRALAQEVVALGEASLAEAPELARERVDRMSPRERSEAIRSRHLAPGEPEILRLASLASGQNAPQEIERQIRERMAQRINVGDQIFSQKDH